MILVEGDQTLEKPSDGEVEASMRGAGAGAVDLRREEAAIWTKEKEEIRTEQRRSQYLS